LLSNFKAVTPSRLHSGRSLQGNVLSSLCRKFTKPPGFPSSQSCRFASRFDSQSQACLVPATPSTLLQAAANHSVTSHPGHCRPLHHRSQPVVCELPSSHVFRRPFAVIHGLPPTPVTLLRVTLGRFFPNHDTTLSRAFCRFTTGHSRVAAHHSLTGYCQQSVRRFFCWSSAGYH